jgi:hypothetical protein
VLTLPLLPKADRLGARKNNSKKVLTDLPSKNLHELMSRVSGSVSTQLKAVSHAEKLWV